MLIVSIFTVVLVGAVAALLANWLNKRHIGELQAARETARRNFARLAAGYSVEDVLRSIGVPEEEADRVRQVLNLIPQTLGVSDGVPPSSATLGEIFRVPGSPREPLVSGNSPTSTGPSVEPFAYDLIANLIEITDRNAWKRRATDDPSFPQTEEELIDRIMGMTVAEFAQFFAPVIRPLE